MRKKTAPIQRSAPALKVHKSTGIAYVILDGKRHYIGKAHAPDTEAAYRRIVAEWSASPTGKATSSDMAIVELMAAFLKHAERHYRSAEPANFLSAFRHLKRLYGSVPVSEFGPKQLRAVRQCLIDDGLCRGNINRHVGRIRHVFRWGVSHELVPPLVVTALETVEPLRRGRTDARENEPVRPVPEAHIEAVKPFVSRQVAALIELQLLTAARAGELLIMRAVDIDMSGKVWMYRPSKHKTEHHGHQREIYIGKKAQAVIRPFLIDRPVDAYLFSPAEADMDRREALHAKRKTRMSCGNVPGSNIKRNPKREPGDKYTTDSYRRAIKRACVLAFPAPDEIAEDAAQFKEWHRQHSWHPHQLRHNAATNLKREFGLEAARVILGHRSPVITEHYANMDRQKAVDVISRVG